MSKIELVHGSCADQEVDVVVNAANSGLWEGGGICGAIFSKAGSAELTAACNKYKTPLKDGDAVITPAFKMKNVKAIIHAVGPNFARTPKAFKELFDAYYNSLKVMMENGYHSISFPLISSGIFGGSLENPVGESTKQCCMAYIKFTEDYPDYDIDVKVCVFLTREVENAQIEFNRSMGNAQKKLLLFNYGYRANYIENLLDERICMKKILGWCLTLLLALVITLVVFEAFSWYHFGDVPTMAVVLRLSIAYIIVAFIIREIQMLVIKMKNRKAK